MPIWRCLESIYAFVFHFWHFWILLNNWFCVTCKIIQKKCWRSIGAAARIRRNVYICTAKQTGMNQQFTYSLTKCFPTEAEIYSFSAKERDAETGLSVTSLRSVSSSSLNQTRTSSVWYSLVRRFGARYYSSDLSIWLSVDPMSDKYPTLSPYVYARK